MKLNYTMQVILSVCLVIAGDVLNTMLGSWIFVSIGFCVAGLIWLVHPVIKDDAEPTKRDKIAIRIASVIFILIGLMTPFVF